MKFSNEHSQQIVDNINSASKAEAEWIQRVLFLSSTLFGILISLFQKSTTNHHARLMFVVAISLLSLGILLLALALYSYPKSQRQGAVKFLEELQRAYSEGNKPEMVSVNRGKFYIVCEKIAYVSLVLSVLSLASYTVLSVI